jgi:hypothetical protein
MFQRSSIMLKVLDGFFLLLLVSSFSLAYFHTKGMSATDMPMPGCPFMNDGIAVLCTMSPLEHIEAWQDMFLAIPVTSIILLCIVTLVFAVPFLYSPKWSPPRLLVLQLIPLHTAKRSPFQSYIQEAFSSGILNPKLF